MKSLYLDLCALKRPFDALANDRVQLEALAVASLLGSFQRGEIRIVTSPILELENSRNPDTSRRDAVADILSRFERAKPSRTELAADARRLVGLGVQALDALHLASAIQAHCEMFVTCDDGILRLTRQVSQGIVGIMVIGPLEAIEALQEEGR